MTVHSVLALAVLGLALASSAVFAHPGGKNAQGCHTNRKTGDYHCHNGTTKPPSKPARPRSEPTTRNGEVYYPNCDAVRAAGKDPIRRGEPGYRPALDRDGDGIACEKSRFNR